jgi:t-SNARE complex subunit (syntaxin)
MNDLEQSKWNQLSLIKHKDNFTPSTLMMVVIIIIIIIIIVVVVVVVIAFAYLID